MELIYLKDKKVQEKDTRGSLVLALGFFDGVHKGHQEVLKIAKTKADELSLPFAVLTYTQHPAIVHKQLTETEYKYLSPLDRKVEILEELGVDYLYLADFTYAFSKQAPQVFVDNYICSLDAVCVVAGFDYTYGPRESANMTTLVEHSKGRFEIISVPEYTINQRKVSSRIIRDLILKGDLTHANEDLGYVYTTDGIVVHGEKRGRKIGYPTANIKPDDKYLMPGVGIYATRVKVRDNWYQAMTSVGYNPTFSDNDEIKVEANIFDFKEMIYGEKISVQWYKHLRDEIAFSSADGLVKQLEKDEENTKAYFESLKGVSYE